MKVSGFTFIRNGELLQYPFIQSIRSVLPICDEFIVAVGKSEDRTLELLKEMNEPKLKIVETEWNHHMQTKGFVFGQQKMIAQYHCTGDWAFYIEGDEVVHEEDLPKIKAAMEKNLDNPKVEALLFDYYHFWGNANTHSVSPGWIRRATRIIKTSIRSFAPDGLFWTVLDKNNKRARYPKAALTGAKMYHYGYARPVERVCKKIDQTVKFWGHETSVKSTFNYERYDGYFLKRFEGSHPAVMRGYYPQEKGLFQTDSYRLTRRERIYRIRYYLEKKFGIDTSKKHFYLVKENR